MKQTRILLGVVAVMQLVLPFLLGNMENIIDIAFVIVQFILVGICLALVIFEDRKPRFLDYSLGELSGIIGIGLYCVFSTKADLSLNMVNPYNIILFMVLEYILLLSFHFLRKRGVKHE